MDPDKWSTLLDDLLVDIFRRLETTALIRCTATCRHWRRAIINNARCLRPRPDRFLPDLLLGIFDQYKDLGLQYVPASNNTALTSSLLTVATTGVSVEGRLYNYLCSSRDGFLLLGEDEDGENLCLWNAHSGICRVLPPATIEPYFMISKYVLVTGYDVSDDSDETAVWILAVQWCYDVKDGTIYQIFSCRTGAWGPVKWSAKLQEVLAAHVINVSREYVVCRGAVSWMVGLVPNHNGRSCTPCIFSMDLVTGRTWTTEIRQSITGQVALAVSEDWKLSLAVSYSHQIEVWVHVGDGEWTLRRTLDVQELLPNCRTLQLSAFCSRSGYLFRSCTNYQDLPLDFLVGMDGSSPRLIERVASTPSSAIRFPFEMDCSTYMSSYLSKMKCF